MLSKQFTRTLKQWHLETYNWQTELFDLSCSMLTLTFELLNHKLQNLIFSFMADQRSSTLILFKSLIFCPSYRTSKTGDERAKEECLAAAFGRGIKFKLACIAMAVGFCVLSYLQLARL